MTGIIFGILGIILTVAFGIYSMWVYKKSKKNVSLEFKNKECYGLFRDDVNRLNIELSYHKKPLTSALILLKANLINNGQIDIDKSRIYKPLKIISPKIFKWLEARITTHPEGATTNIRINNQNEIQIEWDLLKAEEVIEIEALIEIENNENTEGDKAIDFYNGLDFDFRITDLNSIQKAKEDIKDKYYYKTHFKDKLLKTTSISFIIIGLFFLISSFFPSLLPFFAHSYDVEYTLDNGIKEQVGTITPKSTTEIVIKITKSNEKINMFIDEFNKNYKIIHIEKISADTSQRLAIKIVSIVYILLGGLILFIRKRRLSPKTTFKK